MEGWKRRESASPQQLDGISNIRSRNVRNAGQSDLTEKEGGEDRRVRKDQEEGEEGEDEEWHSKRVGGSTLRVIVNVKIQSHCSWRDWHATEQITNSVSV